MGASDSDWEPVLARLTRAQRRAQRAVERLDAAIDGVVDGEEDALILRAVKESQLDLQFSLGQLDELVRSQARGRS